MDLEKIAEWVRKDIVVERMDYALVVASMCLVVVAGTAWEVATVGAVHMEVVA